MVFIYDVDDHNIPQVIEKVKKYRDVKEFILNKSEQDIQITHSIKDQSLEIRQGNTTISNLDFKESKYIIFFRWQMSNLPLVKSSLKNKLERSFAEREWESLLLGIFIYLEKLYANSIWINSPNQYNNSRNKYSLLCIAYNIGFNIPQFIASNIIQNINGNNKLVVKALSSDEYIRQNIKFCTSQLDEKFINKNIGKNILCPSYFQKLINPNFEIRLYYLLGKFLAIKLETTTKYIDIRCLSKKYIKMEYFECPNEIKNKVILFCKDMNFTYCCFDFIVQDSNFYLIDITPNGSWMFYEKNSGIDISGWFANNLLNEMFLIQ